MRVFVYGTLKSTQGAASLMYKAGGSLVRKHTTEPVFKFHNLGGFPGAQLEGTIAIQGELWEVPAKGVIDVLDKYEGYNSGSPSESLFVRHIHHEEDGEHYSMYLYNYKLGDRGQIDNGVWPVTNEEN
jgi:gamma-glutamylcyclotransferase (GGCT)/AIG2-like uncharacterized protein YtfP